MIFYLIIMQKVSIEKNSALPILFYFKVLNTIDLFAPWTLAPGGKLHLSNCKLSGMEDAMGEVLSSCLQRWVYSQLLGDTVLGSLSL